jgi:hypothetical protein
VRPSPETARNQISDDATIPILLSSNKPETVFTVNGKALNPAKMLKVVVPNPDFSHASRRLHNRK